MERIGGNQREMDRAKAQKKAAVNKTKPKESNATLAKRREAYAFSFCSLLYMWFSIPTISSSYFSVLFCFFNRDAEILRMKQKVLRHLKPTFLHLNPRQNSLYRKRKKKRLRGTRRPDVPLSTRFDIIYEFLLCDSNDIRVLFGCVLFTLSTQIAVCLRETGVVDRL
jgi:4F5 protein related disordered region